MLSLKFGMPKRELDLPLRRLTERKDRTKSTFIDPNRIDTVRRPVPRDLSLDGFIKSDFFYNMIARETYEACMSKDRILLLSSDLSDSEESFLRRFFADNNLGVIIDVDHAFGKGYSDFILFILILKLR